MRFESSARTREGGFSLIELIVAMAITLVVTGAIYGLIAGSQNAFRREPEMSERQQNIRMAMDLIMRDIANAASGVPTFVQTFTTGLNACTGCPNGGAPMGPDGAVTDELEMLTNSNSRDNEPVCHTPGAGNGTIIRLVRNTTIPPGSVVLLFTSDGRWTVRNVLSSSGDSSSAGDCSVGNHTAPNMRPGGDGTGLNTPSGVCEDNGMGDIQLSGPPCTVTEMSFAVLVRYRIRLDAAGVPMLERWSSDAAGAIVGGVPAGFQTLARGIENLQVQYLRADGDPDNPASWLDSAPVVVRNQYGTLITQARVTLAARSEAQNIAGATTSAAGGNAIRGSLMSSASPRATLMNITREGAAPRWR